MATRTCPLCLTKVPPGEVTAYSDALECPGCHAPLEVSTGSRLVATTLGLLSAALLWRWTRNAGGMLGWVLPIVYAYLAYSVVSPLVLMLLGDLRTKPGAPAAVAPRGADH